MKKPKEKQMPDCIKERLHIYRSLMNYCVAICLAVGTGVVSIIIKHDGFQDPQIQNGLSWYLMIIGLCAFLVAVLVFACVYIVSERNIRRWV